MGEEWEERSAPKWKDKYYECLDQLEKLERAQADHENLQRLLRQAILRVSLIAQPEDPSVARQLERLKEMAKSGGDAQQVEHLLTELSRSIVRAGEQSEPGLGREQRLQSLLGQLAETPANAERLAKLPPGFISPPITPLAYEAALEQLLMLFAKGAGTDAKAASGKATPQFDTERRAIDLAKGVLESITKGSGPFLLKEYETRVATLVDDGEIRSCARELAEKLRGRLENLEPREVLLRLVERLAVPPEQQAEVDKVKLLLDGTGTEAEVDRAVAAISELVGHAQSRIQEEKRDLESFLKQLTENLKELDQRFQLGLISRRDAFRDGQQLQSEVNRQVDGIAASVQEASDLGILKGAIHTHLATIRNHMETFRQAEESRLKQAEAEVVKLTERVHQMEAEADTLRTRVERERRLALVDPLTGIANRLAFDERVNYEFSRWKRYRTPLCFVIWDIDRFKGINDTYGHQAGDKVLRVVAKLLSAQVRETDFLARFGGEEFVLLLPETPLSTSLQVAEKLRGSIEAAEFHYGGKRVKVTVSCGMSECDGDDDIDAVFQRADEALYLAKAQGRNRCAALPKR